MSNGISQVGTTARQMKEAPQDAIYIWCNSVLDYPTFLAETLGRKDLKIKTPDYLLGGRWRGCTNKVVLDHAIIQSNLPKESKQTLDAMREKGLL